MINKKVYPEQFVNSLMMELEILEKMLEEIHNEKERKSILRQIRETTKYINYLCD